jgi:hypothetical protein
MDLQDLLQVWIWTVTACLHHLQEIWDQDQMGQWDHLQEQKADLWDLLQVKADHLQETWRDQDLMDQWDHLQGIWDQDQTDQWDHLQGIWDQDQMDQWDHLQGTWDQIHYLVIADQQVDHLQVIQEDLLQEIL